MNDMIPSMIKLFERDLSKLEEEIQLYPDEVSLWRIAGEIKNSGGNLCLHLCGNLRHFLGSILGATGYTRNRDHEFSARDIPMQELVAEIQKTKQDVLTTLEGLHANVLDHEYPLQVFGYPMTTTFFLVHLSSHLTYHLGQINYHRRLL